MGRYLNFVFILAVLLGAGTVYDMKMAAERSAERIAALKRQIADEREAIRVLKAEWSILNQPDRLQGLVERYNAYLQLQPLEAEQIVSPEDLPMRPVMLEPIRSDGSLGGYAGTTTVIR
ncbi:cell division protein FtsL [Polymorphum gilvum]|uniref:Uncharacterized protein n=1 Tax=Polymorphum gilvum (strain LMG 25793 / CGMCC 1.9160 / SL003B-26A1) TaxID=991905 RepID=F2J1I6_POLGS|nr:hypothetical protein [Polymorphum gilvum]ADZ69768.1 hypothetical protein SL003B_1340 [Polymorphum gilvum SL003B-26A1]